MDENQNKFINQVTEQMNESPTCFHVIKNCSKLYKNNDFIELQENEDWEIKPGKKYFVARNNSAIASFAIPDTNDIFGFMIIASHGDYPAFKLYNNGEYDVDKYFRIASMEPYPKSINQTWIDVPLSVAGRLMLKTKSGVKTKLINIKKPLLMITSLAPHLTRDKNEDVKQYDYEKHMQPLFALEDNANIIDIVAKEEGITKSNIFEWELFVYRYQEPIIWGANQEFFSSRAVDDQINAFSSAYSMVDASPTNSINVSIIFDNEEVGSQTVQGAQSTFLEKTLIKICNSLGIDEQEYFNMLPNSLIISADNGHSVHPNFPEIHNKEIRTYMGKGVAIKKSAAYNYSTNSLTSSIVKTIAKNNNVEIQDYYNKCGIIGGGTLAKFVAPHISINSCDIGLAQLAMHSSYETCSVNDILQLKKFMDAIFSSSIKMIKNGEYKIV